MLCFVSRLASFAGYLRPLKVYNIRINVISDILLIIQMGMLKPTTMEGRVWQLVEIVVKRIEVEEVRSVSR